MVLTVGCAGPQPSLLGKWETTLSPDLGNAIQDFKPDGTMVSTTKFGRLNATCTLKGTTLTVTSKQVVVMDEATGKVDTHTSHLQPPYTLQIEITRDTLTETVPNGQITVWRWR